MAFKFLDNIVKVFKNDKTLTNNENFISGESGTGILVDQPAGFQELSYYYLLTPELVSIISSKVNDVISEGYYFEGDDEDVKMAEAFAEMNDYDYILEQFCTDRYVHGNGFAVMNFLTDIQLKEATAKWAKEHQVEFKGEDLAQLLSTVKKMQKIGARLQYLPANTVTISCKDKYGENVTYTQTVGLATARFPGSQVIHSKDISINGKLWGYSRIYAIKSEIQMLWALKNYTGKFFDNDGTPDLIWTFEGLNPESQKYRNIITTLESLKDRSNKRKSIVLTDKSTVDKLNNYDKDMEFTTLARYVTSIIGMVYVVPPTRYGSPSGGTEETTLTNQGYYRDVEVEQTKIESEWNKKVWLPLFNVKMKFKKGYKEDETREMQILKTKLDIAQQLVTNNFMNRIDAAMFWGVKSEDIPTEEEVKKKQEEAMASVYRQGDIKDRDALDQPQKDKRINHTPKKYEGTESDNKQK